MFQFFFSITKDILQFKKPSDRKAPPQKEAEHFEYMVPERQKPLVLILLHLLLLKFQGQYIQSDLLPFGASYFLAEGFFN